MMWNISNYNGTYLKKKRNTNVSLLTTRMYEKTYLNT